MKFKNFVFSQADRRGFILLLILLFLFIGFFIWEKNSHTNEVSEISEEELQELHDFQKGKLQVPLSSSIQPSPFDPNTADSITLVKCGLTPWQAHNTLQYRRKGGFWRSPKHFSKLYSLSKEDFNRLKPYIKITPQKQKVSKEEKIVTITYPKVEKLSQGSTIDINSSDTTLLKKIPGVGSYYASKISRYRKRLGGFVSTSQIKDIEGLPEDVEKWFSIEASPNIRKIRINHASFKELVSHPYLNFEQVKTITRHIHNYGQLSSWNDLKFYPEFSEKDFQRLAPYISF